MKRPAGNDAVDADRSLQRTLWPVVGLVVLATAIFEAMPAIDLRLQDHFYHPETGWLVDPKNDFLRMIFYTGPKMGLVIAGLLLCIGCFAPGSVRRRFKFGEQSRGPWMVVFATLATAPLFISSLKAVTHVFCPYELARYGGNEEYKPVFERYTDEDRPLKFGRGFPAGHASGGFALLSLAGVGASRWRRLAGLGLGMAAGVAMGGYQMLKGAHFLSHTVFTAMVCWLIFLIWHRLIVVRKHPASNERSPSAASRELCEVDLM